MSLRRSGEISSESQSRPISSSLASRNNQIGRDLPNQPGRMPSASRLASFEWWRKSSPPNCEPYRLWQPSTVLDEQAKPSDTAAESDFGAQLPRAY